MTNLSPQEKEVLICVLNEGRREDSRWIYEQKNLPKAFYDHAHTHKNRIKKKIDQFNKNILYFGKKNPSSNHKPLWIIDLTSENFSNLWQFCKTQNLTEKLQKSELYKKYLFSYGENFEKEVIYCLFKPLKTEKDKQARKAKIKRLLNEIKNKDMGIISLLLKAIPKKEIQEIKDFFILFSRFITYVFNHMPDQNREQYKIGFSKKDHSILSRDDKKIINDWNKILSHFPTRYDGKETFHYTTFHMQKHLPLTYIHLLNQYDSVDIEEISKKPCTDQDELSFYWAFAIEPRTSPIEHLPDLISDLIENKKEKFNRLYKFYKKEKYDNGKFLDFIIYSYALTRIGDFDPGSSEFRSLGRSIHSWSLYNSLYLNDGLHRKLIVNTDIMKQFINKFKDEKEREMIRLNNPDTGTFMVFPRPNKSKTKKQRSKKDRYMGI